MKKIKVFDEWNGFLTKVHTGDPSVFIKYIHYHFVFFK